MLLPKPYDLYKNTHSTGMRVTGAVRSITENHVYVDLGDAVDGVVFIRELAYARVDHPSEVVDEGETIAAEVKAFNDDRAIRSNSRSEPSCPSLYASQNRFTPSGRECLALCATPRRRTSTLISTTALTALSGWANFRTAESRILATSFRTGSK